MKLNKIFCRGTLSQWVNEFCRRNVLLNRKNGFMNCLQLIWNFDKINKTKQLLNCGKSNCKNILFMRKGYNSVNSVFQRKILKWLPFEKHRSQCHHTCCAYIRGICAFMKFLCSKLQHGVSTSARQQQQSYTTDKSRFGIVPSEPITIKFPEL